MTDYDCADVDGDGRPEFFTVGDQFEVVRDGAAVSTGVYFSLSETLVSDNQLTIKALPILAADGRLGADFLGRYPSTLSATLNFLGWRDLDSDGDMELVVAVYGNSGSVWVTQYYYFANTGLFFGSPPNPYDLDNDGHVNTADLSLLLMEFTD